MRPKDAGGMANSVDPAPLGAVRSESTLFAQTCLSENLGTFTGSLFFYEKWSFSDARVITL